MLTRSKYTLRSRLAPLLTGGDILQERTMAQMLKDRPLVKPLVQKWIAHPQTRDWNELITARENAIRLFIREYRDLMHNAVATYKPGLVTNQA